MSARGQMQLSACSTTFFTITDLVRLQSPCCTGQNKNNTMMQYLMWRAMTGLHHSITISFMVVGHTKFAPDGCFGLLKRAFRKTEVSSLVDLEQVVQSSAVVKETQLVGSQTGEPIVPTRDWANFLGPHYKKLTGIKRYHHFRFDKSSPGAVYLRVNSESAEEKRCLLKDPSRRPDPSDLPPVITPTGLSLDRQQYLHDKIREYCREGTKDLVCPQPQQSARQTPPPLRGPPSGGEAPAAKRRK